MTASKLVSARRLHEIGSFLCFHYNPLSFEENILKYDVTDFYGYACSLPLITTLIIHINRHSNRY
jgi:hypothetical protein